MIACNLTALLKNSIFHYQSIIEALHLEEYFGDLFSTIFLT